MSPALGAFVLSETCKALDYAHKKTDESGTPLRIIHRDVSPSNILLSRDGVVKLTDFGIAKAISKLGRSITGQLQGKFSYMSPEQASGKSLDHRSDIFSLGTVAYELLTGVRPFEGDSDLDTLQRVRAAKAEFTRAEANVAGRRAALKGVSVQTPVAGTVIRTFGNVGGYSPKDAVFFTPFTTVAGIMEKDTGVDPFDAPPELLKAIAEEDFGNYLLPAIGSVPVDFLSNVDTTGGNSGSPTLNAKGELVGLLFDGTYESVISDWDFLPDLTRSIHVDIRYALWVMQHVDGAQGLVKELGK